MIQGLWTRMWAGAAYDDLAALRRAGQERYDDGWHLLGRPGRELACVYLTGYAVELALKAAILDLAGVVPGGDAYARLAQREGASAVVAVKHHRLVPLAQNLLGRRALAGLAVDPAFEGQILAQAGLAAAEWDVFMRYRPNVATEADALRFAEIATWFVQNGRRLVT